MPSRAYDFHSLSAALLVRRWLAAAHARQWELGERLALISAEPDMRACGEGFMRSFADRQVAAGCPRLTDPNPANARAMRASQNASSSRDREVSAPEGRALVLIGDNDRTDPA